MNDGSRTKYGHAPSSTYLFMGHGRQNGRLRAKHSGMLAKKEDNRLCVSETKRIFDEILKLRSSSTFDKSRHIDYRYTSIVYEQ